MRYFDTHAHYFDSRFDTEWQGSIEEHLDGLFQGELAGVVNVGTSLASSKAAIAQAMRHENMYAAAGLHPGDAGDAAAPFEEIKAIEALFAEPRHKLVAVGEIGLDYHFLPFDKDLQAECFHRQMEMAERLALPVLIHDREAHEDCLSMVRRFPKVCGVFHSYSGSTPMAEELVSRGYMISFSGTVSFKNARRVKEVAAALPKHAVMIETDCPYLAPHPHRGEINHSGLLPCTLAAISEVWQMDMEECASILLENSWRFYGLDGRKE